MTNLEFRYVDNYSFRSTDDDGGLVLNLRFARWDAWTQVFDKRNGHFIEWIDQGATDEYFRTQGDSTRLLFHHGMDSSVGLKTLGAFKGYTSEGLGPSADFRMYTGASHVQDILPGLDPEQRSYGLSYRFGVKDKSHETWDYSNRKTEDNPKGLPTRKVHQSVVPEVTVTPFPADTTTNDFDSISARALMLEDAYGSISDRNDNAYSTSNSTFTVTGNDLSNTTGNIIYDTSTITTHANLDFLNGRKNGVDDRSDEQGSDRIDPNVKERKSRIGVGLALRRQLEIADKN